jgi:hypothetical protein
MAEGEQMRRTSSVPIDPTTKEPLSQMAQPGYYSGFSTLAQQAFWDAATRRTVLNRVHNTPPIRFFNPEELRTITAVTDRIIPQDDREEEYRIPVVNGIDDRLNADRMDGYRFESMPTDQEAYHMGLQAIDEIAQHVHGDHFANLDNTARDEVLQTLHDANPPAGHEIWERMDCERFWLMLVQDAIETYYAHPWAWDEIGFGGPAYPRGYFRLEKGQPEPWEVNEQRYAWEAPPDSLSDVYQPVGGTKEHHGSPGQEGTH